MRNLLQDKEVGTLTRPISIHIDTNKMRVCIEETERMDMKPIFGQALMHELRENECAHRLLLDGGEYGTEDGLFEFAGLKKAEAYFVYARLLSVIDNNITRFGMVNKETEQSNRVAWAAKNKEIEEAKETALQYAKDCIRYMRTESKYDSYQTGAYRQRVKYNIIGE